MSNVVDAGGGGNLNPGFGGGGPIATAIAKVRTTNLVVGIGGTTATNVLSAQVSYGFDTVAGEARIVCVQPNGNNGDTVTVTMGAGTHNVQRFSGTLRQFDTTLAPHAVTLICKGPLYGIEEYRNGRQTIFAGDGLGRPGLALEDLLGASSGTLQTIVAAVLTTAGVTYDLVNFANPAHVYGLVAPEEFTWGTNETATAYLHRLLEASEGYRLFDSADGNVYLKQISTVPGTVDFTFTAGTDLLGDSSATDSSLGKQTAVLVEGLDPDGSGPATSGIIGSGTSVFHVTSTLIEDDTFATAIANFWLPQVNRDQQIVTLKTPEDMLLGPAQTIHAVGLGPLESMWLRSATTEITSNGEFTQHAICIAA